MQIPDKRESSPDRPVSLPVRTNRSLLARLRILAGLSQAQLAERVEVHPDSISNWEHGTAKPTLRNALRVADALDSNASDLFPELTDGEQ